jgi:hypothetical protein
MSVPRVPIEQWQPDWRCQTRLALGSDGDVVVNPRWWKSNYRNISGWTFSKSPKTAAEKCLDLLQTQGSYRIGDLLMDRNRVHTIERLSFQNVDCRLSIVTSAVKSLQNLHALNIQGMMVHCSISDFYLLESILVTCKNMKLLEVSKEQLSEAQMSHMIERFPQCEIKCM